MAKSKQLATVINTQFFDHALSRQRLLEKSIDFDGNDKAAKIDKECKRIFDSGLGTAFLPDDSRFFHIAFSDYYTFRRKEEQNALVYRVDNYHGEYTIETGLYCGVINFGDKLPQLEIQTGYSDLFFRRILNFCCGIYADTNVSSNSTESESIYSLLIQYLFLVSLRKVIGKAIPKKYVELRDRGYEIKGNIDVEEYIRSDLLSFDKKITYKYSKRLEIQSIIDVLYTALNCCQISSSEGMPNLLAFREHIKNLYSGVRPSKVVVNNILKEKCLSNRLYADFIKPLEYARVLIKHNDLSRAENDLSVQLFQQMQQMSGGIGGRAKSPCHRTRIDLEKATLAGDLLGILFRDRTVGGIVRKTVNVRLVKLSQQIKMTDNIGLSCLDISAKMRKIILCHPMGVTAVSLDTLGKIRRA